MTRLVFLGFYTILLRLYPRRFRQEFAAEMRTVFAEAMGVAFRQGWWAMLKLWGREIRTLPRDLAREYWQPVKERQAGMNKSMLSMAGMEDGQPVSEESPTPSWGEILLAIAPFLLILLVDVLPKLVVASGALTWESTGIQVLNTTLTVLMIGAFIALFFLAWRQKWPIWSATSSIFFAAGPVLLIIRLLSSLFQETFNDTMNEVPAWLGFMLILAVLLYSVARRNPLRGLLAPLPVFYFLWTTNMEFVPDPIEVAIEIPSLLLVCLVVAFVLRRRSWRTGLLAVLGMNLAVGCMFSYAGTYHGGTLPFTALEPNLVEVARSLIPQYLATSAILMGPLFAWKIRQAGRSAGRAGWMAYHLALAGLLLVILANLVGLVLNMEADTGKIASLTHSTLLAVILLGLGFYVLGLFFLYRAIPSVRTTSGWTSHLLLAFLPLAIPLTFMLPFITWKWPVSDLYGTPLLWEIPHVVSLSIGLLWLALSVWVVTQGAEAARPTAAVVQGTEAPPRERQTGFTG